MKDNTAFQIKSHRDKKVPSILLMGKLTSESASHLEKEFEKIIAEGHTRTLLDLREVQLITSAALRVFLTYAKKFKKTNGKIVFHSMPNSVYSLFETVGFTQILTICKDEEEALVMIEESIDVAGNAAPPPHRK